MQDFEPLAPDLGATIPAISLHFDRTRQCVIIFHFHAGRLTLDEVPTPEPGPDVPIHFTRFHPDYQLRNLPPTPVATLERARETFDQEVRGSTYRSLLPAGQKPPVDLNADEMSKYRDRLKPHYLDVQIHFR